MAGLFARLKGKDSKSKKKAANDLASSLPPKPQWTDAYARNSVEPEEVHELIRCCTQELKARGMLLLSHGIRILQPLVPVLPLYVHDMLIAMLYSSSRPPLSPASIPTDLRS